MTQISLGICPVWSQSSLSTWRNIWSSTTHRAHCEESDQTGRIPRLIWVFPGHKDHFVSFVMRRLKCKGEYPAMCQCPVWNLCCSPGQREPYTFNIQTLATTISKYLSFSHDIGSIKSNEMHFRDKWATTWQNQENECAPSEDSDQPGHPSSLTRVFAEHLMGS